MKAIRRAIYTRKSSEEGLEQGFNSHAPDGIGPDGDVIADPVSMLFDVP